MSCVVKGFGPYGSASCAMLSRRHLILYVITALFCVQDSAGFVTLPSAPADFTPVHLTIGSPTVYTLSTDTYQYFTFQLANSNALTVYVTVMEGSASTNPDMLLFRYNYNGDATEIASAATPGSDFFSLSGQSGWFQSGKNIYLQVYGTAGGKFYVLVNYNSVAPTPTPTPSSSPTGTFTRTSSGTFTRTPSRTSYGTPSFTTTTSVTPSPSTSHGISPSTSPGSAEANMNVVMINAYAGYNGSVALHEIQYFAFSIPYSGPFRIVVSPMDVKGDPDMVLDVIRPTLAQGMVGVKSSRMGGEDQISVFPSDVFYTGIYQMYYVKVIGYTATLFSITITPSSILPSVAASWPPMLPGSSNGTKNSALLLTSMQDQVVMWRQPFSLCGLGLGLLNFQSVVLEQAGCNTSIDFHVHSADCVNCTLTLPLPSTAQNAPLTARMGILQDGSMQTSWIELIANLSYAKPVMLANWPPRMPLSRPRAVLQLWALPADRPSENDWLVSGMPPPSRSDILTLTSSPEQCGYPLYTSISSFICAIPNSTAPTTIQAVLSTTFEVVGNLLYTSFPAIASVSPSELLLGPLVYYTDNVTITFHAEYINPLHFSKFSIAGLECGKLVSHRNSSLICADVRLPINAVDTTGPVAFTWSGQNSIEVSVFSIVTQPTILSVFPPSLSIAGDWIVVVGTHMAADTSSPIPVVMVATIPCRNCSFVSPNSAFAVQCLTPVQLPDPTVTAVEVVVERAGAQSAAWILNYPPVLSVTWNVSTRVQLTLLNNFLTVSPDIRLMLHMKANASVVCSIKASPPRCNTTLQGLGAVSQASLHDTPPQQVSTTANGGGTLLFSDVQLVLASACNVSLTASCHDNKGGSAESSPLRLATPSFSFAWYNVTSSTGALLNVLQGIGVQINTASGDGGFGLDAMSCLLTIRHVGAGTAVVLEPKGSVHVDNATVIIKYDTESVSLDFGEEYDLSMTCTWLPSSEQFILEEIKISTVGIALILIGAAQMDGYTPSSFRAEVEKTVADLQPFPINCSLRILPDSSISLMDVATGSRNYIVGRDGILQPDVTVGFASVVDSQYAVVALDCILYGRLVTSNQLTVQVVKPILTVVHDALSAAIWASSMDEDSSSNAAPTGTAFTITIAAATVAPMRCQPLVNLDAYTAGDQAATAISSQQSFLSRSGISAVNTSAASVLTVTLPTFGIFACSGCNVALTVQCTDGVNRTLTASIGTYHVTRVLPQWFPTSDQVLFQPELHTIITGQLASFPAANISASMLLNQHEGPHAAWSCVALLQPVDALVTGTSPLLANSETLLEIPVGIDTYTVDSWSISVNFTCPGCLMRHVYSLQAECTYVATSEGVRFPPLNLSTPDLLLEWTIDTVSRISGVVAPDGIGKVEVTISVQPTDLCPVVIEDAWACEGLVVSADLAVTAANISEAACFATEPQMPEGCHATFEIPALPFCSLGHHFNLYVMCRRASSSAAQYWLSRPLSFSTPLLSIAWDSPNSLIHAGEQHVVNLTWSVLGEVPLPANVSCSMYVTSGSVEVVSQAQLGHFGATRRAKMLLSVIGASGTVFQLQAACSVWQTSITSDLLQLTVASYSIRVLSHPAVYIPSDKSQVWPALPVLQVAVVDDLNATMPAAWCSAVAAQNNEIIPIAGHDVSTVRANNVNSTIIFPPFGFKSSFTDSTVQVVVSCNVPSMMPVPDTQFTVMLDPLSTSTCFFLGGTRRPGLVEPTVAVAVMRNATALSTDISDCASNLDSDELLPPISCKLSCKDSNSSCALVSLENTLAMIGGSEHTGTFSGLSINAPQNATFLLQLSCSIGSVIIPGPPPTQVHIQGCAPGSQPVGVYCSACDSNTFSYGGDDAVCQRCPENGAYCTDGNVHLLPNFFRSGSTRDNIESSTRLYPCLNAEACLVNSSTQEYSCATGYTGPVCSLCDINANYARFGGFCRACWSPGLIGIFCSLLLAALLGLVAFATFGKHKLNEATVAVVRILLGYMQTAGSLSMMKAGGTRAYHDVLGWTEVVAIYPLSIGALQCIWEPSYLIRFVLTFVLPLLTALTGLGMFFFWVCSKRCCCPSPEIIFPVIPNAAQNTKSTSSLRSSSICTAVKQSHQLWAIFWIAMCVMYMPITSAAIRVFDCYYPDIDGVYYLRQDMRVPCYTAEHFIVRTMAIVILAVVTGGFPLFIIWSLGRVPRDRSKHTIQRSIWRFVSAGYQRLPIPDSAHNTTEMIPSSRKRSFADISTAILRGAAIIKQNFRQGHMAWWHSTELIRQSGMIFLIFVIVNPYVQATGASAWTLIFLLLHMKTWPYRSFVLNLCQFLNLASSLCVSLLCTALLQYDVTSAEMVSQTAAEMSFYSWVVTTALTTVSLGTLAVLGLIGVVMQFAVVAQRMNLSNLHATHRRFSTMGAPRASFRRTSRIPTSEKQFS